MSRQHGVRILVSGVPCLPLLLLGACGGEPQPIEARLVSHLEAGEAIFGIFSGEHTHAQGRLMGQNLALDFVFYSLESGPFDIATMEEYMRGVADGASGRGAHPLALRIPPIRDDPDAAPERVRQGLAAGVAAVVFPHVETGEEAAAAVAAMGPESWPGNPEGTLLNMLLIEDRIGVDNVDAIVGTPGVSVVFPGPGDLRRAFESDMEAVENAIQTVLASCKRHDVSCGITAGVDDVADRIAQGFKVIIVTEGEAVPIGRAAAGR